MNVASLKTVLFLVLVQLFPGVSAQSQVTYNQGVRYSYDSLFTKLDARLQRMATDTASRMRGIVLLSSFEVDTLNKDQYIGERTNKKSLADTPNYKGYIPEKVLNPDLLIGSARAKNDTVTLIISPWFRNGEKITHKISGSSAHSTYTLWNREGKSYTAKTYREDRDNLHIGASASIVLSETTFSPGKTLYGSGEVVSQDFFQLPDPAFKDKMIHLRLRYKYVFRMLIMKDDGY